MAHIRRHPVDPTKWQLRYRDPTGRERSRTFDRKTDAEQHATRVESQRLDGTWVDPKLAATRFEVLTERWIASRSHLKPKTLAGYRSLLKHHVLPRFGKAKLIAITPLSVEEWVSSLKANGLSPSRVRQAHQVLHAVLKVAVKNRYLVSNPADDVALPRSRKREMLFLNEHQVEELALATPPEYRALIYLLAYGGLRWGEACALRRSRLDILRGRLEINESLAEVGSNRHFGSTKNHRTRTITVPRFLRDILNDHLVHQPDTNPSSLVFTASNGAPLRNSNFSKYVWKPALEAAGAPDGLRIHDLRHTAAALMIAEGAHPEKIKRHLGHSSIIVTMDVYGHLFPADDEALAERLHDRRLRALADNTRTKPSHGI